MAARLLSCWLLAVSCRLLVVGCWLLAVGCCQNPAPISILPPDVNLRAGDVVFRRGCGLMSQAVLKADRHAIYSHTGIVVDSCGVTMIVHAVPAEPDYDGDLDRVKMDTPQRFFSSDKAVAGEVRRPHDSIAARRAAQVALQVYRRKTLFDHDYNAGDTTTMYCTELIIYAFSRAGLPLNATPSPAPFTLSIIKADSIFMPSDIMEAEQLQTIRKF